MDEDIVLSFALNKTKPLGTIEPFDGSTLTFGRDGGYLLSITNTMDRLISNSDEV